MVTVFNASPRARLRALGFLFAFTLIGTGSGRADQHVPANTQIGRIVQGLERADRVGDHAKVFSPIGGLRDGASSAVVGETLVVEAVAAIETGGLDRGGSSAKGFVAERRGSSSNQSPALDALREIRGLGETQVALGTETECDRLAGFNFIPRRPGFAGADVSGRAIAGQAAVRACRAAVKRYPHERFFKLLLARGKLALDGNNSVATKLIKETADAYPALSAYMMAEVFYFGKAGVEQDRARGAQLFRQACDIGQGPGWAAGCHMTAVFYLTGSYGPRNVDQATNLFSRACQSGFAGACTTLAAMYQYGNGVTLDLARAAALFRQSCEVSAYIGCVDLGRMYRSGRGVPRNDARAVELFQRACENGDQIACVELGDSYLNGEGVQRDRQMAIAYFRKGCFPMTGGLAALGCGKLRELGETP